MTTGAGKIIWHGAEIPAMLPGLEFDPGKHEYKVNGAIWPNVTGFLNDDFYDTGDDTAAKWGTAAHDHCFHLVKKTLIRSKVTDPRMEATLCGFEAGLKHFGIPANAPALPEYIVYSRKFHFIGRFDFLFDAGDFDILFDLKTGSPSEKASRRTGLQVGAYSHGIIEHSLSTTRRLRVAEINVQLNGEMNPREYSLREVMNVFLAQVTVKNYYNKL